MSIAEDTKTQVAEIGEKYKYGFVTDIEMERAPKGLSEDTVRYISAKKGEPDWMLEWRLGAYRRWGAMTEPKWARVHYPPIDYQNSYYYAAPKNTPKKQSLDEVDPKLLETYKKLGIPLHEQMALAGVAVDAVFDSVSVATTFKEKLNEAGVIFCPISEAIRDYPDLVKKYLGTVVPVTDNFFATLNSAVFSDGTFVYVPKGVRCPMELSTYFRINEAKTGQFERTLLIADEGAYVSYLEGCTAPARGEHQLHAAVSLARGDTVIWRETVTATLTMRDFTDAWLGDYLAGNDEDILSSVGCYQLENIGVQLFSAIEGDYFAILGLPMLGLLEALRREGALDR